MLFSRFNTVLCFCSLILVLGIKLSSCHIIRQRNATPPSTSAPSDNQELQASSKQGCGTLTRLLNPPPLEDKQHATTLDNFFRLAYDLATAGQFEEAVVNYRKAVEVSVCDCDRLHAKAGVKAASEANDLLIKEGIAARPTQFFWARLQDLTLNLPCIQS